MSDATSDRLEVGATIGIIGGGQLGRMLAMAAARLGYHTLVLDPAVGCPAGQVCDGQIVADYDNVGALAELAQRCDAVTYEFENVPVPGVMKLLERVPVRPGPGPLEISQDRIAEKDFLNQIGLPTAPYRTVDDQAEITHALEAVGGRGILKTRRLGYDGKGQLRIDDGATPAADAFAQLGSVPLVMEGFVEFEREISVIGGRAVDGSIACFDPAHNVHRAGILSTSTVPCGLAESVIDHAKVLTTRLLSELEYVGVLGLELFVLSDGSLLANEFAPRVHNSGHWTELGCTPSQFELHIRAVAGLPVVNPVRHLDVLMTNLIGDDVEHLDELLNDPTAMVHLYGKAEIRHGRKMGHVTQTL